MRRKTSLPNELGRRLRVLFFGTADYAVPSLEALVADSAFEIVAVVTQPDRPTGRGRALGESPVKRRAAQLGLPLLQPKRVRSPRFLDAVRDLSPDFIALAAYGQIIPEGLLSLPPLGPVNLHGSLLPAYRGAAPVQHALLNGDTATGNTTMWMDAGMDTGDILLQESMPIEPSDDAGSLLARLAKAGAPLLVRTLRLLSVGRCPRVQQPDQGVSLAPPILPEDCLLRFSDTAESLQNRVRAMSPRPGAFAELGGRRIKVWSAEALAGSAAPGEIVKVDRSGIDAGAADGLLRLLEVQAEGSRRMPAQAWANGARVKPGDRFRVVALTPDVAGGVN